MKKLVARGAFVREGGQSYTASYAMLDLVSGAMAKCRKHANLWKALVRSKGCFAS
jgi:hypothetical protein